jgi:hypothetical protein
VENSDAEKLRAAILSKSSPYIDRLPFNPQKFHFSYDDLINDESDEPSFASVRKKWMSAESDDSLSSHNALYLRYNTILMKLRKLKQLDNSRLACLKLLYESLFLAAAEEATARDSLQVHLGNREKSNILAHVFYNHSQLVNGKGVVFEYERGKGDTYYIDAHEAEQEISGFAVLKSEYRLLIRFAQQHANSCIKQELAALSKISANLTPNIRGDVGHERIKLANQFNELSLDLEHCEGDENASSEGDGDTLSNGSMKESKFNHLGTGLSRGDSGVDHEQCASSQAATRDMHQVLHKFTPVCAQLEEQVLRLINEGKECFNPHNIIPLAAKIDSQLVCEGLSTLEIDRIFAEMQFNNDPIHPNLVPRESTSTASHSHSHSHRANQLSEPTSQDMEYAGLSGDYDTPLFKSLQMLWTSYQFNSTDSNKTSNRNYNPPTSSSSSSSSSSTSSSSTSSSSSSSSILRTQHSSHARQDGSDGHIVCDHNDGHTNDPNATNSVNSASNAIDANDDDAITGSCTGREQLHLLRRRHKEVLNRAIVACHPFCPYEVIILDRAREKKHGAYSAS